MKKLLVFTAAAMMAGALATPSAFAQRDAGSKARGDMTNFWGTRDGRSTNRGSANLRRMGVMPSAAQSYRSFSYMPAATSPGAGDAAVVTDDNAKLMMGSDVVATVPRGTKFNVTKVIGGWLGASIEIDGHTAKGWVSNSNAALDSLASSPQPAEQVVQNSAGDLQQPAVAAQPQEYRSFSYQPSSAGSQKSQSGLNRTWRYLKPDPRRNQ
jgi:hypothetical protein